VPRKRAGQDGVCDGEYRDIRAEPQGQCSHRWNRQRGITVKESKGVHDALAEELHSEDLSVQVTE
jgi:hypothetical protein